MTAVMFRRIHALDEIVRVDQIEKTTRQLIIFLMLKTSILYDIGALRTLS